MATRVVRDADNEWRLLLRGWPAVALKGVRGEHRGCHATSDFPTRRFCVLALDCHGVFLPFPSVVASSFIDLSFSVVATVSSDSLWRGWRRGPLVSSPSASLEGWRPTITMIARSTDRSAIGHTKLNEERRQHGKNRHPDQGAKNTALAARKTGAANEHDGERIEHVAVARLKRADSNISAKKQSARRG